MTEPITLYRRVLGEAFATLPPEIRAMHGRADGGQAQGRCHIRRGRNRVARLIAGMFRFSRLRGGTCR
jgi:hypothetical protein